MVEGQGVEVALGDAAQAFGPVDGVFYLHASARMDAVVGALHIGRGRGPWLLRRGLRWGKLSGGHVVAPDQAQVA